MRCFCFSVYVFSPADVQRAVFARQIQRAVECKKPLIVHTRDAEDDTLRIMRAHCPVDMRIHVHCFTGSAKMAHTLLGTFANLKIGFTGAITFPKAVAERELIKELPLDVRPRVCWVRLLIIIIARLLQRILLETDSPYMAPVPFRGRVSHPGLIPLVAECIADTKGVTIGAVIEQTRKNVTAVYGV